MLSNFPYLLLRLFGAFWIFEPPFALVISILGSLFCRRGEVARGESPSSKLSRLPVGLVALSFFLRDNSNLLRNLQSYVIKNYFIYSKFFSYFNRLVLYCSPYLMTNRPQSANFIKFGCAVNFWHYHRTTLLIIRNICN